MTETVNEEKPLCPECGSPRVDLDGPRALSTGGATQTYECKDCGRKFSKSYIRCHAQMRQSPNMRSLDAKNLSSRTEIKTVTRDWQDLKERLEVYLETHHAQMKMDGYNPATIRLSKSALKVLQDRGAQLWSPNSVKAVIAEQEWSGNRIRNVCNAYALFLRYLGLTWQPPKYTITRKTPFIPTEPEIDNVIAGSPTPLAAFLQLLKETAMRRGEAIKIPWIDVDLDRRIINCNYPEKGSNTRIFSDLSPKLLNMLSNLPRENDMLFGRATEDLLKNQLCRTRKRLAFKLGNPRLKEIHFHTLRHWKATMLYHYGIPDGDGPHDLLGVAEFLGHRNLENTRLYIQLEKNLFKNMRCDKFITRIAYTTEEACKLIEDGFEYHTEFKEGGKIFRKPKIGWSP